MTRIALCALLLLSAIARSADDIPPAPSRSDSIDASAQLIWFEDEVRAVKAAAGGSKAFEVTFRRHPTVFLADAGIATRARKLARDGKPAFVTASLKRQAITRLEATPDPAWPRD